MDGSNNTAAGNSISSPPNSEVECVGVSLQSESNGTVQGNTITDPGCWHNDDWGVSLADSDNNSLQGNSINSDIDIFMSSSLNNSALSNNMTGRVWVSDSSGSNAYNDSTSGNIYYLSDGTPSWVFYNISDTNGDGWADVGSDLPFSSSLSGGQWIDSGQDWHPYTLNRLSACINLSDSATYGSNVSGDMGSGFTVNGSIQLCNDSYPFSGVTALNVTGPDVTIDCAGASISGDGTTYTYGVYSNQSNTTVENCSISDFNDILYYSNVTGGAITGNDLSLAQYGGSWPNALGIYLFGSTSINVSSNNVHDNNDFGIYLDTGSDYNEIMYNNMTDNQQGMYLYYADDNQVGYNLFSGQYTSYGSCPFIYLRNGSGYSYYTDLGGEPLGVSWFKPQKYTAGMYELGDFQPTNGTYDIAVREVIPESDYFDSAKLALVDVPTGYGVLNTWSYTYPFNQAPVEQFMTINDPIAPISATDNYGHNVLSQVSAKDGVPVKIYDNVQNPITLDFGSIPDPQYAKLIITGWAAYNVNSALKPQNYLLVQTQLANGSWVTRDSFGSFIGDSKTIVFNISGILQSNDTLIRIIAPSSSSTMHLIDQVLLDDSAPVPFNVTYVDPGSATLQWGGSTNYVYATIDHRHVNVTDDHGPAIPDDLMYGNFTAYGNVLPLLNAADDEFVVMRSGDELDLQFNDTPKADGTDRYAFLLADDMYTIKSSINGFVRDSIDPMPFHGMSAYPYNGSYANESGRQSYRSEWNTRYYAEPSSNSTAMNLPYSYNNTVFDNTIIGGNPSSTAISLSTENSTNLLYNNISGVETGISSSNSVGTQIIGNIINASNSGNGDGVYLYGENSGYDTDSDISNNTILSDNYGIQLDSSNNVLVSGNVINSSGTSIYLTDGAAGNTALHNNITSDQWVEDDDGGNTYSDSTSGNIYYLGNGTPSWEIYNIVDVNNDSWADTGSDLPFSSSLSGGQWIGEGQDWHPYTSNEASCVNLSDSSTYQGDVQGDMTSGFTVNGSIVMCQDNYSFEGDIIALAVTAPDVMVDCNGASIIGDNFSSNLGMFTDQPGTVIENCNLYNFSTGILLNNTPNATIVWNNISSTNDQGFGGSIISIPAGITTFNSSSDIENDNINASVTGIILFISGNSTVSDDNAEAAIPIVLFGSAQNDFSYINASIGSEYLGESAGVYVIEGEENLFTNMSINATGGWAYTSRDPAATHSSATPSRAPHGSTTSTGGNS